MMEMTPIMNCSLSTCAYNSAGACRTLAITVGPHAECNTYTHGSPKGGFEGIEGGIGACLASDCKYNKRLECIAPDIDVAGHEWHADCKKFSPARRPLQLSKR